MMNKQAANRSSRRAFIIKAALSLLLGGLAGYFFGVRFKGVWEAGRLARLAVFGGLALFFTLLVFFLLELLWSMRDKNTPRNLFAAWLAGIAITAAVWMLKLHGSFRFQVPKNWLGGLGRQAELAAGAFLFCALLPLFFLVLLRLLSFLFRFLSGVLPREKFRVGYNTLFSAFFILACLLPALLSPNPLALNDSFWKRGDLLRAYTTARYRLGDILFEDALILEDWLVYFNEISIKDYQNTARFSKDTLEKIGAKLDNLQAELDARGIRFLFVVTPNKNTIYPEYIPALIPVLGKESRLDQLIRYLDERGGVRVTDLRPALLAEKDERPVYYATDTHWNPYGALVGYRVILEQLSTDFPRLVPYALEDFTFIPQPERSGDIALNLVRVNIPDDFFRLELKEPLPILRRELYKQRDNNKPYLQITTHPDQSLPRLLMYHDSFNIELLPFLANNFSRASFLWLKKDNEIDLTYIDVEKPDIVILELTERSLLKLLHLPDPE